LRPPQFWGRCLVLRTSYKLGRSHGVLFCLGLVEDCRAAIYRRTFSSVLAAWPSPLLETVRAPTGAQDG